jgi:hypothetical protein
MSWRNLETIAARTFTCGHCGRATGNDRGYWTGTSGGNYVYICPSCTLPNIFGPGGTQAPGPKFGSAVGHTPDDVGALYEQARDCMSVSAYTSAVLTCRKILMHVAVKAGAPVGKTFMDYVEFLVANGYVPPNGRGWVDHIRKRGNEANHEIALMTEEQAKELVSFVEMLLKFVYEFPARVAPAP